MVTGSVNLSNAALQLSMNFKGASNDQYMIIDNVAFLPVTSTFEGLPEGATVTANNGASFKISYLGGKGNDVVLTQTSASVSPKFGGIAKLTGGFIQLSGSGADNMSYTVLAATNLNTTNWISIGTANVNGAGAFQFTDSNAIHFPQRFYRLYGP
jgi:hypothetical protein